jgi:CHAD domain-containing protein
MSRFEITRASFNAITRRRTKTLAGRLEKYLENPGSAESHALRIAIRRFQASFRVLPGRVRGKPENKAYADGCKKLLEATARIRDVDVVILKLGRYSKLRDRGRILGLLKDARSPTVGLAKSYATSLAKARPEMKTPGQTRLATRFQKVVRRTASRANADLEVVMTDQSNIQALHSLRRNCRRLRYTLELLPESAESSKVLKSLRAWHGILGSVRDHDVVVEYLSQPAFGAEIREVLARESKERASEYSDVVRSGKQLAKLIRSLEERVG